MKIINKTKLKLKPLKEWETIVPDRCDKIEILKVVKGNFGCGQGAIVNFYLKSYKEDFDAVWFFHKKQLKKQQEKKR